MNSFMHYPSIKNSYNPKAMEYFCRFISGDVLWCATEKVHGSNFSATTDGNCVKWGKRSSFIGDKALCQFNNSHFIKHKYNDSVLHLYTRIQELIPQLTTIQIFGEICGGGYEGVKTSHRTAIKKVQKDIQYSPDIEFIVFDIRITYPKEHVQKEECIETDSEEDCSDHVSYYLNMDEVIELCIDSDLVYTPILHRGRLEDLLELNPCFITQIPSLFNLPSLPNNYSEGYVFKPVNEVRTKGSRVILKHKNPKFSESKSEKKPVIKVSKPLTPEEQNLITKCHLYINNNRMNNVMSKLMDNDKSNQKKIIGLILHDAIKDILNDISEDEKEIFQKNRSQITGALTIYAVNEFFT